MMDKNKKLVIYISGAVILILLFLLIKFVFTGSSGSEIPEISNSQTLSIPVKEQIAEAYKKARRKPTSENLGMLGMVYHSSANYSEAAKCYELAIQKNNTDWIWNYYNGYLNLELGNPEIAVGNFLRVTEINSDINLAWYYLGNGYKNLKNFQQAEDAFNKIVSVKSRTSASNESTRSEHFPLGTYASFELARIYFDTDRTELAEKILSEMVQNIPLFGPSYKLLGNIYNLKGESVLGNQFIVRSNDFINFSPPVDTLIDKLVLLSRSELFLLKKIDEAEKSFHSDWALQLINHGLQYLPDNKHLISKAIKILLWKNLKDQAIGFIDKHMQLFWDDYIEIKNTGIIFYQKDLFAQAAKYWTRAMELKSGEPVIQEYLARSFWFSGDKQKSVEILDELVAQNPGNTEVLINVTGLLLEFGLREKAQLNLTNLKNIAPSNPKFLRISAEISASNGKITEAIRLYEASFSKDPLDTKTIVNLGAIYRNQKMWKKYINLYRNSLVYHPNNPDFLARLGETLISCPEPSFRNIKEGKIYVERAFTYYNCPPDILISAGSHLAYAHSLLGDKQKAITTVSQTINIARRQNIPASQQAKLETMLRAFQQM